MFNKDKIWTQCEDYIGEFYDDFDIVKLVRMIEERYPNVSDINEIDTDDFIVMVMLSEI